jgi:hypothetical protein
MTAFIVSYLIRKKTAPPPYPLAAFLITPGTLLPDRLQQKVPLASAIPSGICVEHIDIGQISVDGRNLPITDLHNCRQLFVEY